MAGETRRALEETLRRVNVASFVGDANGRIVWLNDAATEAFGDHVGDAYTAIVAAEDAGRVEAELERIRSGAAQSDYEIDVILRDGQRRRVEVSSVPIGGNAVCHGIFGVVLRPGSRVKAADSPLTQRQSEVLELLAMGESTEGIAATLRLSRATVRNHIRDLLRALGTHSRIEAVAEARRRGVI
jgi:PAS domain S-box-containing protein